MDDPASDATPAAGGSGRVTLFDTGFRHPTSRLLPALNRFTPYRDVLHLAEAASGLVVATTQGTWVVPRAGAGAGGISLEAELRERIAQSPAGPARLELCDRLTRRMETAQRPVLGRGLAVLCLAVSVVAAIYPPVVDAFAYRAPAVEAGDLWRFVTLHFLHERWWHLAVNALAIWVLGDLLELSIGRARGFCVAALSAAGASFACHWMAYPDAMGASGLVAGLAGGLLWLELWAPSTVPGPWRLPRRPFLAALAFDGLVLAFVPWFAHMAHVVGFVAGLVAARFLAPRVAATERTPVWAHATNALAGLAVMAALVLGSLSIANFEETWEQRALDLMERPDASPGAMNDTAWTIAIHPDVSEALLDLAEELAERAVQETRRSVPHILDTLAEVYFVQGRREEALDVNREALGLLPNDPYLREQRRRYRGERDADDRPDPGDPAIEEDPLPDAPGIRV